MSKIHELNGITKKSMKWKVPSFSLTKDWKNKLNEYPRTIPEKLYC